MKKNIGIWLDHAKAHIVTLIEKKEHLSLIESHVGDNRTSGGTRPAVPRNLEDLAAAGKAMEKRKQKLRRYYKEIIKTVKEAERIYIFGPGEAKTELEKEIKKHKDFTPRIFAVETADKMSENQISAKVKTTFKPYL